MKFLTWLCKPRVNASRRVLEAANNFALLHVRLKRENALRALMLSQRIFRN